MYSNFIEVTYTWKWGELKMQEILFCLKGTREFQNPCQFYKTYIFM